jgi:hypothetical protein
MLDLLELLAVVLPEPKFDPAEPAAVENEIQRVSDDTADLRERLPTPDATTPRD